MLIELTLLVSGYINIDCMRDHPANSGWVFNTGYVESKQVQSLEPRRSCSNVDFCFVNFSADRQDHQYVTAKGSCSDIAKKLKGK